MSKRQEIRERHRKEQLRNRILVIVLVVVGALLITFALILPSMNNSRTAAAIATETTENATAVPVVAVTPRSFASKVDGPHLGDPNAPVKVDAYEDFRCSYCLYYTQNIEPGIIQKYVETGKVYYTYHFFIVIDQTDGTDASSRAANAALCAGEQNRFWDYHDTLYANQSSESATLFTDDRLIKMAQNLGLNMTAFNQCYQAKKYASDIQKDMAQGRSLSIQGTPTIFVNGTEVQNFQQAAQSIDAALAGK